MCRAVAVLTNSGQFAARVFARRFFFTYNVGHPLRTADTEQEMLDPVAIDSIVSVVLVVCWGQGLDEVWCTPASALVMTTLSP